MGKEEKQVSEIDNESLDNFMKFVKDTVKDMSSKYKKVDTKIEHVGTCIYVDIKCRDRIEESNDDSSNNNKKES